MRHATAFLAIAAALLLGVSGICYQAISKLDKTSHGSDTHARQNLGAEIDLYQVDEKDLTPAQKELKKAYPELFLTAGVIVNFGSDW